MGYFANGTEGERYQERYCENCQHDVENDCPVWLAHLLHQSEGHDADVVLDLLIPRGKGGLGNEQCRLFLPLTMAPETEAEFAPAPRLEMLQEGERVRLLARGEAHDPRFRVGGTYAVVGLPDVARKSVTRVIGAHTWSGKEVGRGFETNSKYSVVLTDAAGYRECFPSTYVCRVPFAFGEGLS